MNRDVTHRFDLTRQAIVLFVVAAVPLAFWTRTVDVFQLPKATLVVTAAAALVVIGTVRVAMTGLLRVPSGLAVYTSGAFVVTLLVASGGSSRLPVSLLGAYGRWNGALLYLSCVLLFLTVLRAFAQADIERLVTAVLVSAAVIAGYGALQYVGADPIGWQGELADGVFGTLGNPNFASATMAIVVPLAASRAAMTSAPLWLRTAGGILALGCMGIAVVTRSLQGPLALVAGLGILAVAVLLERGARVRRLGIAVLGAAGAVGAVVVGFGVAGAGLLRSVSDQTGVRLRGYYWEAAASMWAEEPVLGVGVGLYEASYREHRPLAAAVDLPFQVSADAAHSVPLSMFAEGGLLLGLSYVAFVIAVGVVGIRGLLHLEGERRLLLGAVAGAWAAYQVQSLVSIDVPALAMLHWVLAGAVVVLATPPTLHVFRLPWVPVESRATRRAKVRGRTRSRRIEVIASSVGVIVFALLLSPLTRPLRADMAAFRAGQSETVEAGFVQIDRSLDLAPWEPTYWFLKGRINVHANRADRALVAFVKAIERAPTSVTNLVTAARVAAQSDETDGARRFYERALDVEPHAPDLKVEFAEFELAHGEPGDAVPLLEAATDLRTDEGGWWRLLGKAHLVVGDESRARSAFERALRIDPDDESAQQGLDSTDAG